MTPEQRRAEELLRPLRGLVNRYLRLEDKLKRESRMWRPETPYEEWRRLEAEDKARRR